MQLTSSIKVQKPKQQMNKKQKQKNNNKKITIFWGKYLTWMIDPLPCSMMTEKKKKKKPKWVLKYFFTRKDTNKTEFRSWLPEVRLREGCKYKGIVQNSFVGITELFLTVVVVTQIYNCVKIHRTVHPPKTDFYCMI